MLGVAVCMPGADSTLFSAEQDHALLLKTIPSGKAISYSAGSCWSKGDIKDAASWFSTVKGL